MQLQKLREVRESKSVRVDDLAKASGLTAQHIYQLQNGKHSASNSTAILIALLLGVNVCDLEGTAGPGAEAAHVRPLIGQNKGA